MVLSNLLFRARLSDSMALRFLLAVLLLSWVLTLRVFGQCDLGTITAFDGESNDQLGSVAMSSGRVVLGASGADELRGSVYVYRYDGEKWDHEQKLEASDRMVRDQFGHRVSAQGNVIVVGALGHNEAQGAAYVYRFVGNEWVEEQQLVADDGQAGDAFGASVSVDGGRVFVGAFAAGGRGAVYVYRFDAGLWLEEQKLLASDGSSRFGYSVSHHEDGAVIGAIFDQQPGFPAAGAAYVFRYEGASWNEVQKLVPRDGLQNDQFGYSVAVDGRVIVVGSWQFFSDMTGKAYVFRRVGSTWVEEQQLVANDGLEDDGFGVSVDVENDLVIVGSLQNDTTRINAGSAYLFRDLGGSWIQEHKITAPEEEPGANFGNQVSIEGDLAVVAAPGHDGIGEDIGAAYVSSLPGGTDCNNNGEIDVCEIVLGSNVDSDMDFIPDDCEPFIRGDADSSGNLNPLADGLFLFAFQFVPGSRSPSCMDAADADDSGNVVGLVDGIFLLNYFFSLGSPVPPQPYPFCGEDPSLDSLDCVNHPCP